MYRPVAHLFFLGFVASCGGGGGGGVDSAPTSGSLTVTITAPAGVTPMVMVTGPDAYTMTLGATTTLTDLAPGDYAVATGSVLAKGAIVSTIDEATVTGSPATVTAGQTATATVALAPRAGTGHLWYADSANGAISSLDASVLGATGSPVPAVGLGFANNSSPSALLFDHDGNMWFILSGTDTINRLAATKLGASALPAVDASITTSPAYPQSLAFAPNGDLWVGFLGTPTTLEKWAAADLAGTGTLTPTPAITITDNPIGQILSAIAMDQAGNLWVTYRTTTTPKKGTVYEFTAAQLTTGGAQSPSKVMTSPDMLQPSALAFDAQGNLWVADFSTSTTPHNLVRFDASVVTGATVVITASNMTITSTALNSPNAMAFDEAGDLWVTNGSGTSADVLRFAATQLAGTGSAMVSPDVVLTTSASGLSSIAFDPLPATLPH